MTEKIDDLEPSQIFYEGGEIQQCETFDIDRYLELEFKGSASYSKITRIMVALEKSQADFFAHYDYLQGVVKLDPGTAGNEGEVEFSKFLKHYLPKGIDINIGGKIILENGEFSPQIDLILTEDLPEALSGQYIPHEYVIAAFEVKLTLEKKHLEKISKTAALLRPFARTGTPREVLFGRIIYGVLALSSNLQGKRKRPKEKTLKDNYEELKALEAAFRLLSKPAHPSQTIDLILVADAFSLCASKTINYSERFPNEFPDVDLFYSFNLSSGASRESANGFAKSASYPPMDQHLGAFVYNLALLLFREGVLSSKSPEAFFPFKSRVSTGSYTWNIEVLGDDFREEWVSRIDDDSIEWLDKHPVD